MWDEAQDWSWGDLMHWGLEIWPSIDTSHTSLLRVAHVLWTGIVPKRAANTFSHKNPYLDGRICES